MNLRKFGVVMLLAAVVLAGMIEYSISPRAWAAERERPFAVLIEEQGTALSFSVQDEGITSMQVEVRGLDGKRLFQSEWVNGPTVIWTLSSNAKVNRSNGVYLYTIRVRDRDGHEQRKLGKLVLIYGQEPAWSGTTVGDLVEAVPSAAQFPLTPGTVWRQKFGADRSDTYRIQRKPARLPGGPLTNFENLLQLEADGKLHIKELCLGTAFAVVTNQNPDNLDDGGDCRSSWSGVTDGGGSTSNGWTDDGAIVRLANAGDNVGIGTNTPSQKLHVAGTYLRVDGAGNEQAYIGGDGAGSDVQLGSLNPNIKNIGFWNAAAGTRMDLFPGKVFVSTATQNYGLIHSDGVVQVGTWVGQGSINPNGGWFGTQSNHPLHFFTSNSPARMTIDTNGNVGIGTSSPTQKLHVIGNAHVTGDITKAYTAGTANRAMPIAYAFIRASGAIASGTPNVSSTWNAAFGKYEISIAGEDYFWLNYVTVVTTATTTAFAVTNSVSGKLLVNLIDRSTGTSIQGDFQFVTYKP